MPRDAADSQRRRRRTTRDNTRRSSARLDGPEPRSSSARQGGARRGRVAQVDGLRALAIAAVFCYHLDVTWLPSGHLGVIMFLVLTGYLVTSSLLNHLREGLGAIPRFWVRRVLRIWPPVAVMIAFTVLACVIFNHVLLTKARPDVLPGLGLFENISYILRGVSYFDQIGGPSPLTHLWYVGVDIQFCLVWPLIMLLCGALFPSHTATRHLALILSVVSAVAMALLYNADTGITRVYYGTDTRAFAPLLGAWLAYAMPLGKRPARDLRPLVEQYHLAIKVAGLVSLVMLVLGMIFIPDTSIVLYRGGMFVAAILATIFLASLVLPGGIISAVLSLPFFTWLGSRSFGIYLWHFPLIQLLGAANNSAPWWKPLLVAVLSLVLAELSFQLLERPLSGKAPVQNTGRGRFQEVHAPHGLLAAGLLALAVVAVADGIGLAVIPEETLVPEDAIVSTGDAADHAMDLNKDTDGQDATATTDSSESTPNPSATEQDIPISDAVLHASQQEVAAGQYDPVLIGDSVPGDAEQYWRAAFPDGLIDSYVGRMPNQAMQVLDEYLAQGVVGKIVILQAFCNTAPTNEQIEHMIAACGSNRIIYLVNTRIPDAFESQANATIAAACERHDNVHLIDWYSYSEGHDDWLYPDGEHLTPEGQPHYINLLVESIEEEFTNAGGTATQRDYTKTEEGNGLSVVVNTG